MLFKDWKSKDQLVCVKPHPVAIEAQDLICKIMPQCRHCFLYRDAAPNIQSWHSLFNRGNVKEGERFVHILLFLFFYLLFSFIRRIRCTFAF
jgi:hypothetical protein